jgi:hypothetical protein
LLCDASAMLPALRDDLLSTEDYYCLTSPLDTVQWTANVA